MPSGWRWIGPVAALLLGATVPAGVAQTVPVAGVEAASGAVGGTLVADAWLSPDGRYVAIRRPTVDKSRLVVIELDSRE